jgi:hypothetical protein
MAASSSVSTSSAPGDMPIAEVTSYEGLIAAIRRRMAQLDGTFESLDDLAGLTRGHSQKLLATTPRRFLGSITFGVILQALGLKLVLIADVEQLERVRHRLVSRHPDRNNGQHRLWRERVLSGSVRQRPASKTHQRLA